MSLKKEKWVGGKGRDRRGRREEEGVEEAWSVEKGEGSCQRVWVEKSTMLVNREKFKESTQS